LGIPSQHHAARLIEIVFAIETEIDPLAPVLWGLVYGELKELQFGGVGGNSALSFRCIIKAGVSAMDTITLEIPETQLVELLRKLSPAAKQSALKALIPEMDELEGLMCYGDKRVRAICARRGIDWNSLNEQERQQLIDDILHEA